MSEIIPATDTFTEEATHLGDIHSGYARLIAWTTDSASGDSNVCAAGNLHNGYFQGGGVQQVGTTGRFAAAQHASAGVADLLAFVWRPFYSVRAKARLGLRWRLISGAATVADFRRAAVGVRLQNHGAYVNTAGSESVSGGDGYWLVARNVASQPGAKFYLLRVNAGVTTKLAESAVVDVSTWSLGAGMWFYLTVSNVSGNALLRCRRAASSRQLVAGTQEVDIFGGDITDSSASKITTGGRCGFALTRPTAGSVPVADWFEVTDPNTNVVVLRDEWLRANYLVGALTAADANSKTGRNLQPAFSGSVGGSGATRLARDAGANRAKNDASAASVPGVWAFRASHEATQRRSLKVTSTTPGGRTDTLQIDLRGKDLHAPTGAGARAYRLEVECVGTGPVFTARLISIAGGAATTLATKVLAIAVGTHTFDFDVQNVGGATVFDGIPNLVVRVNGTPVTTWTLPGVLGIAQITGGAVTDSRSGANLRGWEQAWRYTTSAGASNSVFIDDWTDASTPPSTPPQDLPNATVSGEIDGLSGTLTAQYSWKIEESPRRQALRHQYDSDHVQAMAVASRTRRTWKVEMPAATQAEVDAFEAFWQSHGGAVPFNWVVNGQAVYGVFLADTKEVTRIGPGVFSYGFEIEERFA